MGPCDNYRTADSRPRTGLWAADAGLRRGPGLLVRRERCGAAAVHARGVLLVVRLRRKCRCEHTSEISRQRRCAQAGRDAAKLPQLRQRHEDRGQRRKRTCARDCRHECLREQSRMITFSFNYAGSLLQPCILHGTQHRPTMRLDSTRLLDVDGDAHVPDIKFIQSERFQRAVETRTGTLQNITEQSIPLGD